MYDAAGYMGVVIQPPGRPPWAGDEPTGDEAIGQLGTYTSYFGTFTVNADEGYVTHHLLGNVRPPDAANNNQRFYEFAGDELILMPPPDDSGVKRRIVWRAPSRDEDTAQPVLREEVPTILATDGDGAPADGTAPSAIQGGRERGTILHKLIEEVLTGETAETLPDLTARAETLIRALVFPVMEDPALGLTPAELAGCVLRALALPEVAALRPGLVPEFPVYASTETDNQEVATSGIVDAIAFDADGAPQVVIDWKSDVDPSPETLDHYRDQVRAYLDITGAERGLVVAVTSGSIMQVARCTDG